MATKSQRTVVFETSADTLLETVTSEAFLLAEQEADEGVESARYREISRDDHHLTYELDITEYGRNMKGVIDRSKRDQAQVTAEWDLKARRGTWTYRNVSSSWADRVKCFGEYRIEPAGDQARLVSSCELSVKIPLAGKAIEKMIIREIEQSYPRYDRMVREHITKRA